MKNKGFAVSQAILAIALFSAVSFAIALSVRISSSNSAEEVEKLNLETVDNYSQQIIKTINTLMNSGVPFEKIGFNPELSGSGIGSTNECSKGIFGIFNTMNGIFYNQNYQKIINQSDFNGTTLINNINCNINDNPTDKSPSCNFSLSEYAEDCFSGATIGYNGLSLYKIKTGLGVVDTNESSLEKIFAITNVTDTYCKLINKQYNNYNGNIPVITVPINSFSNFLPVSGSDFIDISDNSKTSNQDISQWKKGCFNSAGSRGNIYYQILEVN